LPIHAQNEIHHVPPDGENAIGIQFGIQGADVPFIKPFITRLFTDLDFDCDEESACDLFTFSESPCCDAQVGDVVAHLCQGAAACAVCPESHGAQRREVALGGNHEPLDQLIEALAKNAALEAELGTREAFDEERRHLHEALMEQQVENVELKAELRVAEQRHELQQQMMETMAENIRLKAQVELAQHREQYIERFARGTLENEQLKLHVAKLSGQKNLAKHAKSKVAKGKRKGKGKEKGELVKSKRSGKKIRTAKRTDDSEPDGEAR
jgi:hypothetical protein